MEIEYDTATTPGEEVVKRVPASALDELAAFGQAAESMLPDDDGAIGRTMFDSASSEDMSVTVLLPRESLEKAPSQALVRIHSRPDGRVYLGVVVKGPFAEPDGLRADTPLVVTATVRAVFMPKFHGRVQVELLGEQVNGILQPPRFRPLPNSPVYVLSDEETQRVLQVAGDLRLGLATGHEQVEVGVPSNRKSVLPRHTGIFGTTGSGKSTAVAGLVAQAQQAGMAVLLFDVEGEYTYLNEPTGDPQMVTLLRRRGLRPEGVANVTVYHLVGRETANPDHPRRRPFSLAFEQLSPYTVMDILDLSEAQQERFWLAYETTRTILRRLGISRADELQYDEFERGFPGMTLTHLLDIAGAIAHALSKEGGEPRLQTAAFREQLAVICQETEAVKPRTSHPISWRALLGKLHRIARLNVFDVPQAPRFNPREALRPGQVGIVDLSDTDSPELNNLVISTLLRSVQHLQERIYAVAERNGTPALRTLVIIEEAHEFLARDRIERMPHLFAQVAQIAKRGRKRWLGLVFVTQLPQHLPSQVFGLINNWVLHKIGDASVIQSLQRSISGVDESLWRRLPSLAPGQAVVSFTHMQRPVLTAIDPTPAKLRMVD